MAARASWPGARTTSAPRATWACRCAPRSSSRGAIDEALPGGRAGERLHVATGSEIRTYDLRSREPDLDDPGAGRQRAGRSIRTASSSSSASTTGASRRSTSTAIGADAARGRRDARPTSATVDRRRRPPVRDRGRHDASWSARATASSVARPRDRRRPSGGDRPARARRPRRRRHGAALVATTAERARTRPPRPRCWPSCSAAMRPSTRRTLDATEPDGHPRQPRHERDADRVETAIADGRLPGIADRGRRPDRRRDRPTGSRSSTRPAPSVDLDARDGRAAPTAWPTVTDLDGSEAVRHRRARRRRRPTTSSPIGGDDAKDGPVDHGHAIRSRGRARRSSTTTPARWSTSSGSPRTPPSGGRRHRGRPWTVYVVEPHGNARGRVFADARLADGFTPVAWAADVDADYPVGRPPAAARLRRRRGDRRRSSIGSHAFAWRLPGVIAGALTAACLYLLTRILFRRRLVAGLVGAVRPRRRDVLRPVADRHERRLRRPVHRRRLHAVRRDLDGLVARPGWRSGWRCRSSASLLGLALASKWVAALRDRRRSLLLILARSALGRVLAILGLIGADRRARLHGDQRARGRRASGT